MEEQAGWEHAGNRRPPWGRRVAVLGVVVALVASALLSAGQVRRPTSLVVGSETPTGAADDPASWSALDVPTGTMLYLADPAGTVRVLDVDRARVVGEVPLRPAFGDHPYLLARVARAVVLQTDDGRVHAIGAGGQVTDTVDLGRSVLFLPGTDDGVWVVTTDSGRPGSDMSVRLVDLAGAEAAGPTPVPPSTTPLMAQRDRLLLEVEDGLRWWNPRTGRTSRVRARRALATGPTLLVVCGAACRTVDIHHVDGTRVARLRMTEPVAAAVVAPDERAIALLTVSEPATAAIVVVDRDAETMRTVTNGVDARRAARGLSWSADGAWLFFPTTTDRIGAVERATGRVGIVDADAGAYDALAAGSG